MIDAAVENGTDVRELYRSLILDHARKPRHFGKLAAATHTAEGLNPLCGDKLHLYLAIDRTGRIEDASFEGSGCAISVASASLLTDTVIGMQTSEALGRFTELTGALTGAAAASPAGAGVGAETGALVGMLVKPRFPELSTVT